MDSPLSSRRFFIVDLLLLQAALGVAFFLHPYFGLIGTGALSLSGAIVALFVEPSEIVETCEIEKVTSHIRLDRRILSGLIGAAFGSSVGFFAMVILVLGGVLSLDWFVDVVSASCLIGAAICVSFTSIGWRLSRVTRLIYAMVFVLGSG